MRLPGGEYPVGVCGLFFTLWQGWGLEPFFTVGKMRVIFVGSSVIMSVKSKL